MVGGLNLSLISHYINCTDCQSQQQCEIARMLITSQSTSEGLVSSESISSTVSVNDRNAFSEPELSRRSPETMTPLGVRPSLRPVNSRPRGSGEHLGTSSPGAEESPEAKRMGRISSTESVPEQAV